MPLRSPFSVLEGFRPTVIVGNADVPWGDLESEHFWHANVHVEAAQRAEDPAALVAELRRILTDGGRFRVSFTRQDLCAALEAGGFSSVEFFTEGMMTVAVGRR